LQRLKRLARGLSLRLCDARIILDWWHDGGSIYDLSP
jgi:hypothetical protein